MRGNGASFAASGSILPIKNLGAACPLIPCSSAVQRVVLQLSERYGCASLLQAGCGTFFVEEVSSSQGQPPDCARRSFCPARSRLQLVSHGGLLPAQSLASLSLGGFAPPALTWHRAGGALRGRGWQPRTLETALRTTCGLCWAA